ncbi:MAG: acylneuraminate cytidylyltransferase family protein [Candidatus Hodarchaeales archaeon]|jgi:CMP-N-acetylneuraminic acid synthetase
MDILGIIPARGKSKGVFRKNLRHLLGKPLIAYTIEVALKSTKLNRVIVTTDDSEIASVSRDLGAEIIMRPDELAMDDSPTIDALIHTLDSLNQTDHYEPNLVILIQPTSPLRTAEDIDRAIEIYNKEPGCTLVSVIEYPHPPQWSLKIENGYLTPFFGKKYINQRRQDLETIYSPNGAIYIASPRILRETMSFYSEKTIAYVMSPENSLDIDTEGDFITAEHLMRQKGM